MRTSGAFALYQHRQLVLLPPLERLSSYVPLVMLPRCSRQLSIAVLI